MENNNKKKKHFISIFRFAIQIISFVLVPALYINAFAGIHAIYSGIINSTFNFVSLWPQIVEVAAIIPITILFGRFFCGWMCAFGTLGDLLYLFSSKVFKIKFKMNETTDRVLKSIKYILLAFLVTVVWTFGIDTFTTFNPWDVFGFIFTVGKMPAIGYAAATLLPGFIILLAIMAGSLFVERFFCRYLCPLGAIFVITSRLRIAKVRKPREKCGKCTICTQNCAMGIPLYKSDDVCSGECINCFQCVTACPRSNVSIAVAEKDLRPVVAGVLMASVISGTYYAGSLAANSSILDSTSVNVSEELNNSSDSSISYSENSEGSTATDSAANADTTTTAEAGSNSASTVVQGGSSSASTEVQSGSSSAASQSGSASSTGSTSTETASGSTSTAASNSVYNDGTYQGTGTGFRGGQTTVSVTVSNDKITDVTIVSHEDDRPFFNRCCDSVISQILSSQSSDVNAVSGATYSSNGIMSAVADALSSAAI